MSDLREQLLSSVLIGAMKDVADWCENYSFVAAAAPPTEASIVALGQAFQAQAATLRAVVARAERETAP